MPVDWRPNKPFQVFLEERRRSFQMNEKRTYQGRVFNDKGQFQGHMRRDNQCDIHGVEGVLEVQRQLLLKLAEKENRALAEMENNVRDTIESTRASSQRLDGLKADTVQAIQKTWSQRSQSAGNQPSRSPLA
jgi:hypothetical protein